MELSTGFPGLVSPSQALLGSRAMLPHPHAGREEQGFQRPCSQPDLSCVCSVFLVLFLRDACPFSLVPYRREEKAGGNPKALINYFVDCNVKYHSRFFVKSVTLRYDI